MLAKEVFWQRLNGEVLPRFHRPKKAKSSGELSTSSTTSTSSVASTSAESLGSPAAVAPLPVLPEPAQAYLVSLPSRPTFPGDAAAHMPLTFPRMPDTFIPGSPGTPTSEASEFLPFLGARAGGGLSTISVDEKPKEPRDFSHLLAPPTIEGLAALDQKANGPGMEPASPNTMDMMSCPSTFMDSPMGDADDVLQDAPNELAYMDTQVQDDVVEEDCFFHVCFEGKLFQRALVARTKSFKISNGVILPAGSP